VSADGAIVRIETRRTPLPTALAWAARPLAWCYGAGVAFRNARFDRGGGVRTLPVPVVSIGNLVAGGTGKTPCVAWTVAALAARGHRPLIAMRGYGARPGEQGDEELEYRSILPNIPVVAHPKRADAVLSHLAAHPDACDAVVLDDGFQHRGIARALDVVLVDASRPSLDDALLPSGWLREPAANLRRAHAVIVTRASEVDAALASRIAALHGRPPIAWTRHAWRGLEVHAAADGGGGGRVATTWLRGRRVALVCGVGHPGSVVASLEAHGAIVAETRIFRDHAAFDAASVRGLGRIAERVDAIVATRKDWVKLAPFERERSGLPPIVVPDLAIEFLEGEAAYLAALRRALAPG
jgi:tetraacyldisaccharide 4'-kinase